MENEKLYDTLIVGSGPAGLSAAIYAQRAGLTNLVIEKMFMGTGQVAQSDKVDNYLGMPGMNGFDMGMAFRKHAEDFGVEFLEGEVLEIIRQRDIWKVRLADGTIHSSRTVIYAAGAAHRHLNVPGEETFMGRGVSYCAVCDGAFYRGKIVAVAGGGNTAVGDAEYLSEICEHVYLIHRRSEFRADSTSVERLRAKENVTFLTDTVITEIRGEGKIASLVLGDGTQLKVDGLFVAVGMEPQTSCIQSLGVLDETGYVVADENGITAAEGFYAAGDVRTKKLRQIITAASDGANAVHSVKEYLDKDNHRVNA